MANVSDHAHPMHKGPHHDKYIHAENRGSGMQVHESERGDHALGDKSHIKSIMGKPKGADVTGHDGKMHW